MGNHSDGSPNHSGTVATAGQNEVEKFQDPGLPPHRLRLADTDPKAAKRAERQVAVLFGISVVGTLIFLVAYFAIDLGEDSTIATIRLQNALLGIGTAFAMLGIGTGIVHWAKALMPDHEVSEERHAIRTEEDRQAAVRIVDDIVEETGIKRRPLIRNTLLGAVALAPLPAIAVFGDLGPRPDDKLAHTMWAPQEGKLKRLTRDPDGTPIKASDVTIGSAFHVIPEGLNELHEGKLNEKAKAVVLLMRLNPESLQALRGPRGLELQRHRCLLQDLHPRRLPCCPVRAADAPPAVPVPPVDLRPDPGMQGYLRPGQPAPPPAAHRS